MSENSKDFAGSLSSEDREPMRIGKFVQIINPETGQRIVPVTKEEIAARAKSRPNWGQQSLGDVCPWCGRSLCEC